METTQKNEQTSSTPSSESRPELDEQGRHEVLQQTRMIKRTLKNLSKNQIIQLLLEQVNHSIEQQNINQVLMAELKELKNAK